MNAYRKKSVNDLTTVYRNDIENHGPYVIDGLSIYVVSSPDKTFLFHRESTAWAEISVPEQVVDWKNVLLENRSALSVFLRRAGLNASVTNIDSRYTPSALMLFPTERCNLRCLYCHCDSSDGINMPLEIAQRSIEEYIEGYCSDRAHLSFMGGGEPTLNFHLMKESEVYFREKAKLRGLTSSVNVVTNGCCSQKVADWLLEHCDNVSVSYDGLPELQNKQRPLADGSPSWPLVERFFSHVSTRKEQVAARVTVSFDSLHLIDDIVAFSKTLPISRLQIEAAYKTGRGRTLNFGGEEDYEAFFRAILSHYGSVRNSWLTPFARNSVFCSAPRGNFIVTPQGNISVCTEISEKNDDISKYGIVGRVYGDGVRIDRQAFRKFQLKTQELLTQCRDCVIRYKCGGGCFSKRLRGYDTDDPSLCKCVVSAHLSLLFHAWDEISKSEKPNEGGNHELQ